VTATVTGWVIAAKVAVTLALAVPSVTVQAPVPVQAPDQPVSWVWGAGVAVRLTDSPW
jgi:hypothetical protein